VDPHTGLAAYGPYGVTRPSEPLQLRLGIIGPVEAVDKTCKLLEEISQPIEQSANVDCVQHPSFPGMNSQEPFRVHVVTQRQWHRPLQKRDFRSLKECGDPDTRRWLLQEVFGGEVRALSELENPPQVILCAVSEPVTSFLISESDNGDPDSSAKDEILKGGGERAYRRATREFRADLKAECMGLLPTEIVWDREDSKNGATEDRATRAWNLSLGLLHKAGIAPWRLANASGDSCFVGISYYRASQRASSRDLKSLAHVVTEHGESFIIDGDCFEWDPSKEGDGAPHLDETNARRLLSRALTVFEEKTGASPRKVGVHKGTPYFEAERRGFENALRNVSQLGFLTITQRGIFCVRPGRKPILRGTAIPFDDKLGLIFTSGYIPFLRGYSGNRIPQPLEITENWGSLSFQQVAQDLLRLTKLNLNSPAFSTECPMTLVHRRKIGDVLQALVRKEPSIDDKYYL
jgi:hypothetical protein